MLIDLRHRVEDYTNQLFNELMHEFDIELCVEDRPTRQALKAQLREATVTAYLRTHD